MFDNSLSYEKSRNQLEFKVLLLNESACSLLVHPVIWSHLVDEPASSLPFFLYFMTSPCRWACIQPSGPSCTLWPLLADEPASSLLVLPVLYDLSLQMSLPPAFWYFLYFITSPCRWACLQPSGPSCTLWPLLADEPASSLLVLPVLYDLTL